MNDVKELSDTLDSLIGDVPVSVQLCEALSRMSAKDHVHENYADRSEVDDLKRKIEMLFDLIGDTSVSEQINAAINKIK